MAAIYWAAFLALALYLGNEILTLCVLGAGLVGFLGWVLLGAAEHEERYVPRWQR